MLLAINNVTDFLKTVEFLLLEKKKIKKLKTYSIIVPPTTKEECIKAILQSKMTSKVPWTKNVNGKGVEKEP